MFGTEINGVNIKPPLNASGGVPVLQPDGKTALWSLNGGFRTIGVFLPGVGTNSQVGLYMPIPIAITFPANAPNSLAKAKTAATGSTTYTFTKNGVSFATVNFGASSAIGTFTQAASVSFSPGDILEIDGSATADSTLANIGFALVGTTV